MPLLTGISSVVQSDYKALQYIQALDDARCEGNWDAVGELVRKIRKHAPDRNCKRQTISKARTPSKPSVRSQT